MKDRLEQNYIPCLGPRGQKPYPIQRTSPHIPYKGVPHGLSYGQNDILKRGITHGNTKKSLDVQQSHLKAKGCIKVSALK